MERRYPTRNGISVPVYEIDLPETKLNLELAGTENDHHGEWPRKTMGTLAILQTLRDLDRSQYMMPIDVHTELHRRFAPPELPTPTQALDEITEAYNNNETMKVYDLYQKKYIQLPITFIHMQTLHAEYNEINEKSLVG